MSLEQVEDWQQKVKSVPVSDPIFRYVIRLCDAIRNHTELDTTISNRGALALMQMSRAVAFLEEHDAVFPEDVKRAFIPAVLHRIERGDNDFESDNSIRRRSAVRLLLEELLDSCRSSVIEDGDDLILTHMYIERCLRPLNLFLRESTPELVERVRGIFRARGLTTY